MLSKRGDIAAHESLSVGHELYWRERSFSTLRRIKNAQRTTIEQGRLNMLKLMSIESESLRTIDVNSIIDDFARVKARKHNM